MASLRTQYGKVISSKAVLRLKITSVNLLMLQCLNCIKCTVFSYREANKFYINADRRAYLRAFDKHQISSKIIEAQQSSKHANVYKKYRQNTPGLRLF